MRKIKVAQIGVGHDHALCVLNSIKKQDDIFEFAGVAMLEGEKEKFSAKLNSNSGLLQGLNILSADEIFSDADIDAVIIETEEKFLTEYALKAAASKKHIHMDKPGGLALADFERLIALVKKHNTIFHTGYMYRYNPFVKQLIKQVRSGDLGKIFSVEAHMSCAHPLEKRQWLSQFRGGMMFYLGCHLIDLVLQIQGAPDKVIPLNKCISPQQTGAEDLAMSVLEYKNGVSFVKTCAAELGGFARRQLVVTGSKGTVELKPFEMYAGGDESNLFTGRTEYRSESWGDTGIKTSSDAFNRYDDMMASFAAMVRGEKANPYSYDYELELYKTILKCCGVD